jgi:DNA-binding MarR family transcriptional regulator
MLECFITDRGLQILARLNDAVNRADADALRALTRKEIDVFNDLLSRIRHAQGR